MGRIALIALVAIVVSGFSRTSAVRLKADAMQATPSTVDAAIRDLRSADRDTRLRAVRLLRDTAALQAALPLAPLINDPDDEIQYEAIAAALNIFMADKVESKRRVGLVFEVRNRVLADAAFSAGPFALGAHPVPSEMLAALLAAVPDDNAYIGIEALYAFGALAMDAAGPARRELLRGAAPEVAAFVGASEPGQRVAALRVIGRVYARQVDDLPVDEAVGDAVVFALNDQDRLVREAARAALGRLRYERSVQALTDLLQHYRTGAVADELVDALARIGHATSRPTMIAVLATGSIATRRSAIEGLARMDDAAALTAIDESLGTNRNEQLLLARSFAAARLGKGSLEEVVDALSRSRVREQAVGYLIELAPIHAPMLGRYAQDPDPAIRTIIADALGLSGDAAALRIVELMTKDADPRTSRAAARAAARLAASRRPS